jgi:predicted metal-dependent peptidase
MRKGKDIVPEKEVSKAIVDLIRNKIFYAQVIQQLAKVYCDDNSQFKTMAVGKRKGDSVIKLYMSKSWIKWLWDQSEKEEEAQNLLIGTIEHEVLHLIMNHLNQTFADKQRGGIAVDLAVNSYLTSQALFKEDITPERYGFESKKSAMWYYVALKDNKKYQDECKNGSWGWKGFESILGGRISSHVFWEEAAKDPMLSEIIKDILNKAKKICNGNYGNISADIIEQIDLATGRKKAILPWKKIFRNFCASAMESTLDYTMKRESKRFGTRPGTKKEDVLNLAVAVDTSGSVSSEMLKVFLNEINWIYKNGAVVTMYEADSAICKIYKFNGKFTGQIHGRGGTDLEPVLKDCERKYDALIYFTDFCAPVIETRYNIPILWVLTEDMPRENFPYQWGHFVKIDCETREQLK